jgi:hypothetical protein
MMVRMEICRRMLIMLSRVRKKGVAREKKTKTTTNTSTVPMLLVLRILAPIPTALCSFGLSNVHSFA